jgi:hypothetical protein
MSINPYEGSEQACLFSIYYYSSYILMIKREYGKIEVSCAFILQIRA